jgi:hypothetical protein
MEYVSFNQYQKLAELEVLSKKLEIASVISAFGEQETASGTVIKRIPLNWVISNFLDFSPEQLDSMRTERKKEYKELGFNEDGSNPQADQDFEMQEKLQDQQYRMGEMEMEQGMQGMMGQDEDGYDEDEEYGPQPPQNQRRR